MYQALVGHCQGDGPSQYETRIVNKICLPRAAGSQSGGTWAYSQEQNKSHCPPRAHHRNLHFIHMNVQRSEGHPAREWREDEIGQGGGDGEEAP